MEHRRVRFEPYGVEVEAPEGTTVLQAARSAGLTIASSCGGRGTCGDCAVRILEGAPAFVRPGQGTTPPMAGGVVLACLAEVSDGLIVQPLRASQRR